MKSCVEISERIDLLVVSSYSRRTLKPFLSTFSLLDYPRGDNKHKTSTSPGWDPMQISIAKHIARHEAHINHTYREVTKKKVVWRGSGVVQGSNVNIFLENVIAHKGHGIQ